MMNVLIYFIVFAAFQLLFGFGVPVIAKLLWSETDINSTNVLLVSSGLASAVTVALFYLAKWCPMTRDYIRSRPWTFLSWTMVLAFGLLIPLAWIEEFIPESWRVDLVGEELKQMLSSSEGYFVICMLAPLAEEVVFRGAMITSLMAWLGKRDIGQEKKKWCAIVISALLFALIHINPAQIPHALIVGVILGWLYVKSGSIVPGFLLHWVNNSMAYVFVKMFPTLPMDASVGDYMGGNDNTVLMAVGYSMLLVLPALYQLAKSRTRDF